MNAIKKTTEFEYCDKAFGDRKFYQDANGQWYMDIPDFGLQGERLREAEVIDIVKGDKQIRQTYFPMYGFHN